jgi:16S rRNA (uracil1498-N3)-methyltransferase
VKQFLLPRSYAGEPRLTLTGGDFRYLVRVLRLVPGDERMAVDARGRRYGMRILEVGASQVGVEVSPQAEEALLGQGPEITLLQCLPKGRKIDLIVRQATEAGVSRIVPVVSAHSLVRPDEEGSHRERLLRIAREALQQSGAMRMPTIDAPRSLASVAEKGEDWGRALFFHERPLAAPSLHRLLAGNPSRISMLIGPEGGLSEAEVGLLGTAGFAPVYLGADVLRVETAALFALGAVRMIIQERDSWTVSQDS